MRIVINIDPIRQPGRGAGKRLRFRTRYNLTRTDGRENVNTRNALIELYGELVGALREGVDPAVNEFIDEGEQ